MKKVSAALAWLHAVLKHPKARKIILGLFVLQALLLVFVTHVGTPPDEDNHTQFIQFYAEHSPGPIFTEQEPTWYLGDKTREVDYLYHFAMSWVIRISPLPSEAEIYLIRLFSVVFALATFVALVRLWQRLKISEGAINVALLVLTNLPMVLMMSSAINNDTLVWLGSAVGALLVVRLWQQPRPLDAVLLLGIITYGGLVKRTMFPVALALGLLLVAVVIRQWPKLRKQLKRLEWRVVIGLVLVVLGIGLLAERVGGNIYQYGTITPSCEKVQGEQACKVFWASARAEWLKDPDVTRTSKWLHGGATKQEDLFPAPVFTAAWWGTSFSNLVDIQAQGWKHAVAPPVWLGPVLSLLFLVGLVAGLVVDGRSARRSSAARLRLAVVGIAMMTIVAQFVVNYNSYQNFHVFGLALNGRYLLPAVLPLMALVCFYFTRVLKPVWSRSLALVTVLGIVAGSGIIMMLRNSQLFTG